MRFHMGKRTLGNWTRGHPCYILAKHLSTFSLCPETLSEAKFKRNVLINLVERTSRHWNSNMVITEGLQPGLQWEIGSKKKSGKIWKICSLSENEAVSDEVKEISAIKKKLSTLYQDNRKMPWSRLRTDSTYYKIEDVKVCTDLKDCTLRLGCQGALYAQGHLQKCFSGFIHLATQRPL
jgi:hypothetical protein